MNTLYVTGEYNYNKFLLLLVQTKTFECAVFLQLQLPGLLKGLAALQGNIIHAGTSLWTGLSVVGRFVGWSVGWPSRLVGLSVLIF